MANRFAVLQLDGFDRVVVRNTLTLQAALRIANRRNLADGDTRVSPRVAVNLASYRVAEVFGRMLALPK
jgi:hypothetical protein